MTGVGGGSLMTPILVLLFSFHPATAVGTDLLYASVTKSVGTAVHGKRETVDWKIVGGLACGSVPAAIAHSVRDEPVRNHGARTARCILNLLLGGSAAPDQLRGLLPAVDPELGRASLRRLPDARMSRWTILLGAILGVLVSVTSVGAGALGTTALLILYPKLPVARIAGSDIAHAVPLTLIAGLGHWMMGSVDFTLDDRAARRLDPRDHRRQPAQRRAPRTRCSARSSRSRSARRR